MPIPFQASSLSNWIALLRSDTPLTSNTRSELATELEAVLSYISEKPAFPRSEGATTMLWHPSWTSSAPLGLITPASTQAPFPSSRTPISSPSRTQTLFTFGDEMKTPKSTTINPEVLRTPLGDSSAYNTLFSRSPHLHQGAAFLNSSYSLSIPWQDTSETSSVAYSSPSRKRARSESPSPSTPHTHRRLDNGSAVGDPQQLEGLDVAFSSLNDDGSFGNGEWILAGSKAGTVERGRAGSGNGRGRGRGGGRQAHRKKCGRGAVAAQMSLQHPAEQQASYSGSSFGEPLEQEFQHLGYVSNSQSGSEALNADRHAQLSSALQLYSQPVPHPINLSRIATDFVHSVAIVCRQLLDGKSNLSSAIPALDQAPDLHKSFPLECIARRTAVTESRAVLNDFTYMINVIQFRCEVARTCHQTKAMKSDVIRTIDMSRIGFSAISRQSLERYISDGARMCLLAGAGSLLLLAIIAKGELKSTVKKITHSELININYLFKCPDPNHPLGKLIIEDIIPALVQLRERHRLMFLAFFDPDILLHWGVIPDLCEVGNFELSDEFFHKIQFNSFIKPRHRLIWKACYSALQQDVQPVSRFQIVYESAPALLPPISIPLTEEHDNLPSLSSEKLINNPLPLLVIDTGYDSTLKVNQDTVYGKRSSKNKKSVYIVTTEQRLLAEQAMDIPSFKVFSEKLCQSLLTGHRLDKTYLKLSPSILQGQRLRINDSRGDPLLIVCPDLPDTFRERLIRSLNVACPDQLHYTDSKVQGKGYKFSAYHFTWWNRYAPDGTGAPVNVEPCAVQKRGKKKKPNASQLQPHTSRELERNHPEFEALKTSFEDVFEWVQDAVYDLLPSVAKDISKYADVLPAGGFSPTYPFAGSVINFNVSTKIHRDVGDKSICVVMAISKDGLEGGDICFLETGLRLPLRNGDMIIFPSAHISHFNLHFRGERASLVFHSDGTGDNWVANRNGWEGNLFINVNKNIS